MKKEKETNLLVGKWKFIHLRAGIMMAWDQRQGCYVYISDSWQQCIPESSDILSYSKDWFHNG